MTVTVQNIEETKTEPQMEQTQINVTNETTDCNQTRIAFSFSNGRIIHYISVHNCSPGCNCKWGLLCIAESEWNCTLQ